MSETKAKVPVHLGDLSGPAGNAYAVLGQVAKSFREVGREADWSAVHAEMTSGDYDHLLDTVLKHCDDLDGSIERLRDAEDDE